MSSPTEKKLVAKIEVVGQPVGRPRPRARAFVPAKGFKHTARVYPVATIGKGPKKRPHPIVKWEELIVAEVKNHTRCRGLSSALVIERAFRFRRPGDHWGTGKNTGKLRKSAPPHHIVKPDIDNLDKPALDCLKAAGVIKDDCIVVGGEPHKRYCGYQEVPGLTITIWKLED